MNREDCILFSGAAKGAESAFGKAAERHGIEEVNIVTNSEFTGNFGYCTYQGGRRNTFTNNYCHGNVTAKIRGHDYGIHVYRAAKDADDNLIINNRLEESNANGACILVGSGARNLVYNNTCKGAPNRGILINYSSVNSGVYNNTIYGSGGICIEQINGTGSVVKNNICYRNGSDTVKQTGGSAITIGNNLLGSDPHFVDSASGDFHLTASSTNAINQASGLSSIFTTDKDGSVRGRLWDIGAFEYDTK